MASEKRFGYEWAKYRELDPSYERQFKQWLGEITPAFMKGKKVLDAGCGMGRNSFWALTWGAKEATAFDNDDRSVASATKLLRNFPNAKVFKKSIYDIAFRDAFDIVFSIGVIHHLADPTKAIQNLWRAVKPGGTLVIWVYGYSGNEWIVKLVNPIRRSITSKLPLRLLDLLSAFASVPLWIYVKLFRPSKPYLRELGKFSLRHIHSIVFDQLLPEIAHYWTKEEVAALFSGLEGAENLTITGVNNMSWNAHATKRSAS